MDYFILILIVYTVNPKLSLLLTVALISLWVYAKLTD